MTNANQLILVILLFWALVGLTIWLAAWTLNKHVPRRRVGRVNGLTMPSYPNDDTYEVRNAIRRAYDRQPPLEPQTMPFGVVDWRQRNAMGSEYT